MSDQPSGFFVAPFVIDGELEGIGFWEFAKLSDKWMGICRSVLDHHAESFQMSWEENLSHINTKVTADAGVALVTFRVHGTILSTIALVNGSNLEADNDLLKMFIASLKRIELTKMAAKSAEPFERMLSIEERPLMVVVPWPNEKISEDDFELTRELGLHFAAAFFKKASNETAVEN